MQISDATRRAYDPALADVLGAAGDPVEVTHAGRVYKLGFPTQRAKDRFEKYVLAYEKKLVLGQKAILDPDDFQARVDKLSEQIEQRAFATGGAVWLKHASRPVGWLLWVRSLFAEHHPDITEQQVADLAAAEPEQLKWALEVVVPPFLAWVVEQVKALALKVGDPEAAAAVEAGMAAVRAAYPAPPTPTP